MPLASGLLNRPAYFIHWGVVQISLPNFLVILLMIAIFVLALLLPFPHGRGKSEPASPSSASDNPGAVNNVRSDGDDNR